MSTWLRARFMLALAAACASLGACNSEATAPPVAFVPGDTTTLAPCEGQYCDDTLLGIYDMNPFYRKILVTNQIAVVGSYKVRDEALEKAVEVMEGMIGGEVLWWAFLVEAEAFTAVMAEDEVTTDIPEHRFLKDDTNIDWDTRARGLGGTPQNPITTAGEENLLCLDRDRYAGESILVHEFAHSLHALVFNAIDPSFDARLDSIHQIARTEGIWADTYANENRHEYWAEGVQSWFNANQQPQEGLHNHVDTREELAEHDPALYDLIASWFDETEWTPVCPTG